MESLYIDNYEFLEVREDGAHIIFSTARGNLSFNINEADGKANLNKLKEMFNLVEVGYLRQIHSSDVFIYDGIDHEGDAIITDKRKVAIGVFTADCMPILIYDKTKKIIAAVHSGWKGTLNCIGENTILKMQSQYNSKPEDLIVYIGPHNRSCCYEVGSEVKELFSSKELYKGLEVVEVGKLNMEKCVVTQLEHVGVSSKNIHIIDACTYCNKDLTLYSYRKLKDKCGRMFSFIYLT